MRTPNRIKMEDLKRILNEEIALYNRIEQHLAEKKQHIIQGNLEQLVQVDNELEKLSQQGKVLEQERLALMVSIGREGETLREFIASLESGEDSHLLNQARTRLIETTNSIKTLSKTNRDLLTQSIRFIEQSVNVIASILAPEGASYQDPRLTRQAQGDPSAIGNFSHSPSTISREA